MVDDEHIVGLRLDGASNSLAVLGTKDEDAEHE
jgi:hypothetical protein